MKKVLSWVKGHLVIVICGVLALLFIPAGIVGGHLWNKKVAAAAKSEYDDTKKKIDAAKRVTYSLPTIFEGEAAISETRAPNAEVTRFFADQKARRESQVGEVVRRGVAFNKREHEPIVSGLFPTAASERERRRLTRDLARKIVGDDQVRSVYVELLERINAGQPEAPELVASALSDARQREIERLSVGVSGGPGGGAAGGSVSLPPEQAVQLAEEMARRRLGEYARRAAEISVYAGPDAVFGPAQGAGTQGFSRVPTSVPEDASPSQTFTWQWDYWVIEDVLDAVAAANTDPISGGPTGVADSVVKRIDRVDVQELNLSSSSGEDDPFAGGRSVGASGGPGAFGATFTGRLNERGELSDTRMVRLVAIVSSERLPKLFDALAQTNLMTVTGVRLETIDPWEDLKNGFYYGSEPVVRATLDIETVWLRAWTGPLMPPPVRDALGVVLPEAEVGESQMGEEP